MGQTTTSSIARYFTDPKAKAYDMLTWVKRDASIKNQLSGETVFQQKDIEIPENWSLNALSIVAQQYFTGAAGTKGREISLRQLVDRVVDTIVRQGVQEGYVADGEEAEAFREELKYIVVTQRATFDSPVWANLGAPERAQRLSGCFILGVEDTIPSILQWYTDEATLFRDNNGDGINVSPIRSSIEPVSKRAIHASGPLGFMRAADGIAGTIMRGAETRRSARMVILNVDHPDIEEFIWCKSIEADKARVLQEAGYDTGMGGKSTFSIQYRNANNSVCMTDEFISAVENNLDWKLKAVTTLKTLKTVKARDLWQEIAEAGWRCADPGLHFDATINKWHTTPIAGHINGSSSSGEYMGLDNSTCNLASINLLKYVKGDGSFDIEAFKHTVEVVFTAQEILVGYSEYPTPVIAKVTRAYRPLGIGYVNLGAMLAAQGLLYDSAEARAQAAAVTALMTGHSYATSAKVAQKVGPFAGYSKDREGVLRVLRMHREAVNAIDAGTVAEALLSAATQAWDEANELAELYGVRNSQASLLAQNGITGTMMDCDTTGIEPSPGSFEGKKPAGNTVHYLGEVRMMAAVQPFLSGGISKTIKLPAEATVDDVERLYAEAWKMGLKAVAVCRDNAELVLSQPIAKTDDDQKDQRTVAAVESAPASAVMSEQGGLSSDTKPVVGNSWNGLVLKGAVRRKLPKVRNSRTYKFEIADLEGYFTVGEYEDGTPGELFISVSKQGSTLSGLMDSFAISVSHGLQYGVPLKSYVKTLRGTSFAPNGITDDIQIRTATSITDYIMRRLGLDYLNLEDRLELGLAHMNDLPNTQTTLLEVATPVPKAAQVPRDAGRGVTVPLCYNCGNQTERVGDVYVCSSCGSTMDRS